MQDTYQTHPSFQEWSVHMFTPFTPTAEAAGVREPFLNQYPYHAAQAGQMQSVPLITSVTTEEGLYPAAGEFDHIISLSLTFRSLIRLTSGCRHAI